MKKLMLMNLMFVMMVMGVECMDIFKDMRNEVFDVSHMDMDTALGICENIVIYIVVFVIAAALLILILVIGRYMISVIRT